ncbi:MAG TPA: ribonuclease E/G, partial [Mycobacterium sp.]|nr:ribonuclease E/G [Mycobacterium sp.]
DFIDMVLESNRDLVLRRLTEALARDRTRHQVSEVTSLGLVQLTRKRLGTGLIEAFSTSCPHCSGRGIMVHSDPVDSATPGRKSDSAGRRGKRSKKSKPDEPVVAKVPSHPPGEHPMFKAMAEANGRHDEESVESEVEPAAEPGAETAAEGTDQPVAEEAEEQAGREAGREELDDTDEDGYDDTDEDEDDEDEVEVDLDDDEDFDDDLDVIDDSEDSGEDEADVAPPAFSRRRRAAARPAGPPIHED